jgi:hypothetical protein
MHFKKDEKKIYKYFKNNIKIINEIKELEDPSDLDSGVSELMK